MLLQEQLQSVRTFDWTKCVLCQTVKEEKLRCPFDSKQQDADSWCDTLCSNVSKFHELGGLPIENSLIAPDLSSKDLANLFRENKAKWHKSCRNKLSNFKLERAQKRKAGKMSDGEEQPTKLPRRSVDGRDVQACYFCEETTGKLHRVSTFKVDANVRECAALLNDSKLLGKLSAGDMMAFDAMYHSKCLTMLYRKAAYVKNPPPGESQDSICQGLALAELILFIEDSRNNDSDDEPVFKLSDLSKMYVSLLEQMGIEISERIHTTRLKERILEQCPDITAHKDGREVYLVYSGDLSAFIKTAKEKSHDDEAMVISRAAKIIRRDLLDMEKMKYSGTFDENCQENSVPQSLRYIVEMMMCGGPSFQENEAQYCEEEENQAALSVSQLIRFNSVIRRRKNSSAIFHSKERETPLPTYIGLLLHAETRKRGLIDKMSNLGLSISYNRVLEISTEMGNLVSARFREEQVLCPSILKKTLFTTSAVDNIDHNPSSTTATGSLHGTAISLFQHLTKDNHGQERAPVTVSNVPAKGLSPLPQEYAEVPPVDKWKKEPEFPCTNQTTDHFRRPPMELSEQKNWLCHVKDVIESDSEDDDEQDMCVSWAAFHASQVTTPNDTPADISSLLPLFQEDSKSVAMIIHTMNVVKRTVQFLNPGQTPVLACDQPLFALAKKIQWKLPEVHGEKKLVVMLGGLHIEMTALRALGDWLEGSGWISAIMQANVASAGTADSFLKASHVSRTRHAHQVTACSLHILMCKAYDEYVQGLAVDEEKLDFEQWKERQSLACPHFKYWATTLEFQLTILLFVQSLRDGRFSQYKDTINQLLPWFFALDKVNYARWLTVHLHDMMSLGETCADVEERFEEGFFVVHKTQRKFSALAIDHAHEQNNKLVKGRSCS